MLFTNGKRLIYLIKPAQILNFVLNQVTTMMIAAMDPMNPETALIRSVQVPSSSATISDAFRHR
jgi:hypothetical protein